MNERELLNLLRAIPKALRAIQQDAHAIYEQYRTKSHEEKPPAQSNLQIEVSLPPAVEEYCASEERDRPKNTRRNNIRLCFEGVALLAALLAAFFTFRNLNQIRRQADSAQQQIGVMQKQFEAADRPWVKMAAISITSPLTYDSAGVKLGFNFVPQNIGRSPAQNIWISAILTPAFMGEDLREIQKRICGQAQPPHEGLLSYLLFPGDSYIQPFGLDMSAESIKSHWGKMPPEVKTIDPIPIALVGCVDGSSGEFVGEWVGENPPAPRRGFAPAKP
jgi:hypothetical protein